MAFDAWLAQRARTGDRAAFEKLCQKHATRIENIESNFYCPDAAGGPDDLHQVALQAVWAAVQKHRPAVGSFEPFMAAVIANTLKGDRRHRTAARRWAGRGAQCSLDSAGPGGGPMEMAAPSWCFAANPLAVVLYRDDLARAWLDLKAANREALNEWLARDGQALDQATRTAANRAQRQAVAVLRSPDGIAPACSSRRPCQTCGDALPPGLIASARYCSRGCHPGRRASREPSAAAGIITT